MPEHLHLPPPPPLVRKRTPFWHCAAGAGIWYLAGVVGVAAHQLKRQQFEVAPVLGSLVGFGLVWLLTTTVMWGFLRLVNARVKPWLLIIIAIPVGYAMMGVVTLIGFAALFAFMPR